MTDSVGFELPRAMPIVLTFYDWLVTYPYTSTFYVPDSTPDEACHRLICVVSKLSLCVLGQYKIGFRQFTMPDFNEAIKTLSPVSMGTVKWRIQYHNSFGLVRSHMIPGFNFDHSLGASHPGMGKTGKAPNLNHEEWQQFLIVFREICVSKEGEVIPEWIEVTVSSSKWPPPGWKKRQK